MDCRVCLKSIQQAESYEYYHDRCLRTLLGSVKISPSLNFSRAEFFTEKARDYSLGLSISGVQQKLSVKIDQNTIVVTSLGGTYLLKPSPESFEELAANEHLSLTLSKQFGIDTAESSLIPFRGGELCLLVKRFDRVGDKKIHQEDLVQAMSIPRGGKGKYSLSYEAAGKFIKSHTSLAIVKDFFERVFFNFMIGNGDCHLKNISLRQLDGILRLTPNYDLVNTTFYEDQSELALDLLEDDELTPERKILGNYSQYDFNELGKRLGLNQRTMDSSYKRYFDQEELFISLVQSSCLSNAYKALYLKTMKRRKSLFSQKV